MTLTMSDDVKSMMDERGILESDIREMLAYAEGEGHKLYLENEPRFLGKKRIGNFTVYAEYSTADAGFELFNVYSHRVMLDEDMKEE